MRIGLCFGVFYWWESALGFGVFGFLFLIWLWFEFPMVWISLVDCVRIVEFDHGFVYVFAYFDAKKMQEKEKKLSIIFIFWATMFLGKNMKNNQSFSMEENEKNLHVLPKK